MSDLDDFRSTMLARQAEAEHAMVLGDPEPRMEMWSRRDPLSLLGAATELCKTGWSDLSRIFRWVASTFSDVSDFRFDQIGTAFMRCPEAATSDPHRDALTRPSPTALTRAFSGRRARGIVNAFMRDHSTHAPPAYPHVLHLTAPVRAAARKAGDADAINLWAGQAHALAEDRPAGELVRRWSAEARAAIEQAHARLTVQGEHLT